MLTNISLYWLTATAASSARLHHDAPRRIQPCPVPLGVAVFAHDIIQSVRPLAERRYDIRHWSEFDRGGHFAAMEVPELLAADIREFFLTRITGSSPSLAILPHVLRVDPQHADPRRTTRLPERCVPSRQRLGEEPGVLGDELLLTRWKIVLEVDRLHRAHRFASATVDAVVGLDVGHPITFEDAVDRALFHTGPIQHVHTRGTDHERHTVLLRRTRPANAGCPPSCWACEAAGSGRPATTS